MNLTSENSQTIANRSKIKANLLGERKRIDGETTCKISLLVAKLISERESEFASRLASREGM